ncbi:hypothetical protein Ciccas_013169 [Cichlidogyrus casuarinus]|uniref:UNC-45/Cro1/She4 central domain-containing protein n=1 Tax=Cichlidogyrus casuarinus TaxID=1844966 RepID=A0ABD2PRC9_9PLAT
MIVACLLAKISEDLVVEKLQQQLIKTCTDYILDLLSDKFIESKVEAASVLGTFFYGPFELGNAVLTNQGIIEGMLLLSQSSVLSHQTVALDTIILATNKKDKCLGIVDQAVPLLKALYKSPNDSIKIRALVGLCKLGVAGGSDASIKALGEGSTLNLAKSCKRLLVNNLERYNETKTDNVSDKEEAFDNVRWAVDGFAFLSLDADVKQVIVEDKELLQTIFSLTKLDKLELGYPLVSLLGNLANSQQKKEIEPEMVELAQYAKQHIPEEHELDLPQEVEKRRRQLVEVGVAVALYNCTFKLAAGTVGSRPQLREEISK